MFENKISRFKMDLKVGISYTGLNLCNHMLRAVLSQNNRLVLRTNQVKQKYLMRWIKKSCISIIHSWEEVAETATPFVDSMQAPIWMIWLQGVDQIPQECIPYLDSIRRHNADRPIKLVDLNTAKQLVNIPSSMLHCFEEGRLSPAHLSDYIRFALLENYGGIWVDLSIYQVQETPAHILDVPTWSVKGLQPFPYASMIPDGLNWQIYYMASQPHALFNKVMLALMEWYWSHYDVTVDYFLNYYFAAIVHEIPIIDYEYNKVPINNSTCEQLTVLIDEGKTLQDQVICKALYSSDTWIYKGSRYFSESERDRSIEILKHIEDMWEIPKGEYDFINGGTIEQCDMPIS